MKTQLALSIIAGATLALAGCSDNDANSASGRISFDGGVQAIVSTVAPDYSGADLQLVAIDNGDVQVSLGLAAKDQSDYKVAAYNNHFYHLGRYNIDRVERYSFDDAASMMYSFSALDDSLDPTANPYSLVFASDEKAYLMRYNSDKVWIVNPSAAVEEDFKIGELDLSAYNDSDGKPEANGGIVVDGKLYVVMERLVYFDNTSSTGVNPYVAVFDVASDSEVDTDLSDDSANLKGIELLGRNPGKITHNEDAGIFVAARSDYYGASETEGGVIHIDPSDYAQTLLIDDDVVGAYVTNITILGKNNAFLVAYNGWKDTDLVHFNPTTGELTGDVEGFAAVDIGVLETGPLGNAWVGVADAVNPRIHVINGDEVELGDPILLDQNPNAISFKSE